MSEDDSMGRKSHKPKRKLSKKQRRKAAARRKRAAKGMKKFTISYKNSYRNHAMVSPHAILDNS